MHRSTHFAFDVLGAEAAIATLHYPGDETMLLAARLSGVVPADTIGAPWPVVVIMPGINVTPDSYRWLAGHLVEAGVGVVTYQTIGDLGPAGEGITPGIDMGALAPDVIGSRCSAPAVAPLLAELAALGEPVTDVIDLDRVVIGGHSAGGTVALHNSDPSWIPGLRGVFSFGGHTMISTSLGHDEATVVRTPSKVPMLVAGGAHDGVIAASRDRYRSDGLVEDPVERTFREGIDRDEHDSWFVELARGNHFTICDPVDTSSGRSFLEADLRTDDSESRELLAAIVVAFVEFCCDRTDSTEHLERLLTSDLVSKWENR